jgi:CheY-like chemotaxis protein
VSIATLISFGAAVLQLGFGTMFLLISRAHGWQRGRLFAALAYSAAAYSAVDIVFTLQHAPDAALRIIGPLNYLFGAIHCAGWLLYAYSTPERPWRSLGPRLRALVIVTLGFGVIAQIPGTITAHDMQIVVVPWLDSVYRQPKATAYASFVGAWLLVVLAIAFTQFVRNLRRGVAGARVQIAGFTAFFVCAVVEVLVTNGVITFIYPADLGFLAVVLVVLTETVRRILSDARTLEAMGRDFAEQVERRTRKRDDATDALAHAERLAAVGQLAAGVGHEINNPLTVVQVNLELMRDDAARGGKTDGVLVGEALDGVHRISRVVADLRSYGLPETEHREVVTVASVVHTPRKLASHRLRHVAAAVEGTVARVILPTAGDVPAPAPVPDLPARTAARRRLLIVDDEPIVGRSIGRQLTSFEVTIRTDGQDALELLRQDSEFDVVLCDLMMPRLSGFELHAALAATRPEVIPRMLFMTGGAVTTAAEEFLASPGVRHVLKPFTRAELVRAIEDMLMTSLPERAA